MSGLNIRLRIWLSIGIFVLGSLVSAIADQVGRIRSERDLRLIASTLVPAVNNAHNAKSAFSALLRGHADTFLYHDTSGLERAVPEGEQLVSRLDRIARSSGLAEHHAADARRLKAELLLYLEQAGAIYAQVPARSAPLSPELLVKIRNLGMKEKTIERAISELDDHLSKDLETWTNDLEAHSVQMRRFSLAVLISTLLLAVVLVDLTIRRAILQPLTRVQADLAHERDLLRILLDHVPDYIYFKDVNCRFIRINKALADCFGVKTPERACGRNDSDFWDTETAERLLALDRSVLATGEPLIAQQEPVSINNITRWMSVTKIPVNTGSRTGAAIVGISRDITEWKRAMEDLKWSEASFRLLFNAIPYAVLVCDVETLEIVEVNEAAIRIYGYSAGEFQRLLVTDIYPENDRARLRNVASELNPASLPSGDRKHLARDGRVLDVEIVLHLLEFHGRRTAVLMAQDLTEHKRLEIELRHAQRLESVGQLAAGVAHEINTPIQYVGDNLRFLSDAFNERQAVLRHYELLVREAEAGALLPEVVNRVKTAQQEADMEYLSGEIPKAMTQALEGVERVSTIVRAMKAFAHPGGSQKAPADLNKALSDALIVSRNELKYVAEVTTDFGALPLVLCNLGDLNQVFLNLLINAAHAIGDVVTTTGGKGRISVRTRCEADDVIISICDTGCGIPDEIAARVFDPFFTTKEVGKGTGQGLAIARNIVVDRHGGRIVFERNVPQGTTFIISLPVNGGKEQTNTSAQSPVNEVIYETHSVRG